MTSLSPQDFARLYEEQLVRQTNLPPLPHTVQQLLVLKGSDTGDIRELAAIVDSDPLLAAQMLRYGQSPLFGYGSRITSTEEVISLVLGYEPALFMALGMGVGKSLESPAEGVLGLEVLWRDGFYNAALCVELARQMPATDRPVAGLCHLSGLLHNIGFLLLGHLHPTRLRLISSQFEMDPSLGIIRLEKMMLGVSHDTSGAWLAKAWGLPDEVVTAILQHHNESYRGEHAAYAQLVNIASHLLSEHGVSEMVIDLPSPKLLEALGLTSENVEQALASVLEGEGELARLAKSMIS